jgi:hypothetical protein
MGSLHQIQHKQIRKMPTPCCQICDWGLLKRKQCYIYAKGTKMANFTTKKNQHKNGNDVQRCVTLCLYLPRTTVHISSQEGTGGICLLGDVINMFVPT